MAEDNGVLLRYRVDQAERAMARLDTRLEDMERELVAMKLQLARWAALGGVAGSVIVEIVRALAGAR